MGKTASSTPSSLPDGFGLWIHPKTGLTFAQHLKYSSTGVTVLVPRQCAYNVDVPQHSAAAQDAKAWLKLTEKTRNERYPSGYFSKLGKSQEYFLLDV